MKDKNTLINSAMQIRRIVERPGLLHQIHEQDKFFDALADLLEHCIGSGLTLERLYEQHAGHSNGQNGTTNSAISHRINSNSSTEDEELDAEYGVDSLDDLLKGLGLGETVEAVELIYDGELDLSITTLSNASVNLLYCLIERNLPITTLYLGNTALSIEHLESLADAIGKNTTLKAIMLDDNAFKDGAGKAIASIIKTNRSIQTLDLEQNSFSANDLETIAEALQYNRKITSLLLGLHFSPEQNLHIGNIQRIINENNLPNTALKLHDLLTKINLKINLKKKVNETYTDQMREIEGLVKNAFLGSLDKGVRMRQIYPGFIENNPESLKLDRILSRLGLLSVIIALQQYIDPVLDLSGQNINSTAQYLLAETLLSKTEVVGINLENATLEDDKTLAFVQALRKNNKVTHLDVAYASLSFSHFQALMVMLCEREKSLLALDLSGISYEEQDVTTNAVNVLLANRGLGQLVISNISLHKSNYFFILCRTLQNNEHKLQSLDLSYNKLDDSDAKLLAEVILHNKHLTHLNLSGNHFTDAGLHIISRALNRNHTLEDVLIDKVDTAKNLTHYQKQVAISTQHNSQKAMYFKPNKMLMTRYSGVLTLKELKEAESRTTRRLPSLS